MIKYKLTNRDMTTYNGFKWEVGVAAPELSGDSELCTNAWYHYYHDPLLAVLFNPAHANFQDPIGWKAKVDGKHIDDGVNGGCTVLTLVSPIKLPSVSMGQRIAFSILCAKEVYEDGGWNAWADRWLLNIDRSLDAAADAADAAADAAYAAIHAARAADAAARADYAATHAAYAAADAATDAARAADAAAHAARAADYADYADAYAAYAAADAAYDWSYKKLLAIAKEAMKY